MNFEHSEKVKALIEKLSAFMDEHVYPIEKEFHEWNGDPANSDPAKGFQIWPGTDAIKAKAREAGLWNLFLPLDYGELSGGLSNLEYAPLAEIMGRMQGCSEFFNCSSPDTGNMEVLAKFGSPDQQQRWLRPLLDGQIRSAYLMTEPAVASSDATQLETSIFRDGDDYVINGTKWFITGILDPRCSVLLVMGKTDFDAPKHEQHSTIIVPRDTPGVSIVRAQKIFGSTRSPEGEAIVRLENVRVPKENLIWAEGKGFAIAQGRLGPGRIHHCMRSIGQAQRSLELMVQRADSRFAFGKKLSEQGSLIIDVAHCYFEIEQARLLTLKAADKVDKFGAGGAKDLIAAIKVAVPRMAQSVTDRAMQVFGGMGVTDDTPIAGFFLYNRFLRLGDGPDEVHATQLGRGKIKEYAALKPPLPTH
jgi:acyl-CoA dehydrogenase